MRIPNADFRPDPNRAVYVNGTIDQSTLDQAFPEILRTSGHGPITLYIDSPGGSTFHAGRLQRMLVAPDLERADRRRLITVATGFAGSAAADLLIAGDYTLAYNHAIVMMHGVRQNADAAITTEGAASLARALASSNEQFALDLAANCVSTFFFRVVNAFPKFAKIREDQAKSELSDVDCFIADIGQYVSLEIRELLSRAAKQCVEMEALDANVRQSLLPLFEGATVLPRTAAIEVAIFGALLQYELQEHQDPDWSFGGDGFDAVREKARLLIDQTADRHKRQVGILRQRWGLSMLALEEILAMHTGQRDWHEEADKVSEPRIRKFWFFLVALCRNLQTADFYLSAEEAYWLGFVDEVIGRPDLPSPRIFAEFQPDDKSDQEHHE